MAVVAQDRGALADVIVRYVARLGAERDGPGQLAAVHAGVLGAAGHGHVRRGRRLRRRRERRARRARPARLRPQRRAHPQLHRQRHRHAQLDLRRSAAPTSATSSTSRTTSPTPQVVKLEQNYRSTQTILDAANAVIAQQPRADAQDAVDRPRRRATRSSSASSTTSTPRRGSSSARSSGSSTRALSRAEIAVFYRTNAQSRVLEDTLVRREIGYQVIGGTKFYERAEIKDAIAYLTLLGNPQDAVSFHARRQLAAARHRPDVALARAHATPTRWASAIWDAAADAGVGPGPGRRGGQGARRASWTTMERLRERAEQRRRRSATCSTRCSHETGYMDCARGRAHDRGAGPDGEPRRSSSRSRASSTRARRGRGHARRLPAADRARRRRRRAPGRRGPRHADDAAQRQGPRVPDRLHDRLRGGGLPALALDRRGRPRGGAPALLRRHHARDAQPHADPRAPAQRLRLGDVRPAEPLPRRDPAEHARPRGRARRLGRRARRRARGAAPAAAARALVAAPTSRPRRRRRRVVPRSATTSSTRRSARASSPASSPAGSSSSASPATDRSAS